jgi:type II secretory pathway pseudopilin PulG
MKKMLALMVGFLVLGFAAAAAQDKNQVQTKAQEKAQAKTAVKSQGETTQNKVQAKSEFRHRNRIAFVDENGDGINDLARDADGDGIPNGQDPDWTRPKDGTGYQARNGQGGVATTTAGDAKDGYAYQLARDDDGDGVPNGQDPDWVKPQDGTGYKGQNQNGRITKSGFGKNSFRNGLQGAGRTTGTGVCDGTGPKGAAKRKGGR